MAINLWRYLAQSRLDEERNAIRLQALEETLFSAITSASPTCWHGTGLTPPSRQPAAYEEQIVRCISMGVDINIQMQGHTPLMLALARRLSPGLVKKLLDLGAQVNFPMTSYCRHQNVLRYCFATNRSQNHSGRCMTYLDLLLAAGANPNSPKSSMIAWCMSLDLEPKFVYKLAAHLRPDLFKGEQLLSPLGFLELLQAAGVDPVEPLDTETSILEWACLQKEFKLVRCLLSLYDDAAIGCQFCSALHDAIEARWNATDLRQLLQCGASPDMLNNVPSERTTPLALAAITDWSSQLEVVKLLLEFGARPNFGHCSCTPLIASIYTRTDTGLQVMQALLAAGACPDLQSRFVRPALGYAPLRTWTYALEHERVLLPLTAAVLWNCPCAALHEQYVSALLRSGATVDMRSPHGSTTLEQALESTPEDPIVGAKLCVLLLAAGAAMPQPGKPRNERAAKFQQIVFSYGDRIATIVLLRAQLKLGACWSIVTSFLLTSRLHASTLKHRLI